MGRARVGPRNIRFSQVESSHELNTSHELNLLTSGTKNQICHRTYREAGMNLAGNTGLRVSQYWYLDIKYRIVSKSYNAVTRMKQGRVCSHTPARDASTILRKKRS